MLLRWPPIPMGSAGLQAVVLGFALAATGCGWHLGTPSPGRGLKVGEVTAAVAEPAVADDLEEALGRAVRRRGAAGSDPVEATVEEASFVPTTGGTGGISAWNAILRVRFQRLGPHPRELALARDLLVPSPDPASSAGLPEARAAAFAALAQDLAEEAVEAFLLPAGPP